MAVDNGGGKEFASARPSKLGKVSHGRSLGFMPRARDQLS
jgi:hypothetical protein